MQICAPKLAAVCAICWSVPAYAQPKPNPFPADKVDGLNAYFYGLNQALDEHQVGEIASLGKEVLKFAPPLRAFRVVVSTFDYADKSGSGGWILTEITRQLRDGTLTGAVLWDILKREIVPFDALWWPKENTPTASTPIYISSLPPTEWGPVFFKDSDGKYKFATGPWNPKTNRYERVPQQEETPPLIWPRPAWVPRLTKEQLVGVYSFDAGVGVNTLTLKADGTLSMVGANGSLRDTLAGATWNIQDGFLKVIKQDGSLAPMQAYDGAIVVCGEAKEHDAATRRPVRRRVYAVFIKTSKGNQISDTNSKHCGVYAGSIMGTSVTLIVTRDPQVFTITSLSSIGKLSSNQIAGTWKIDTKGAIVVSGGGEQVAFTFKDGVCFMPIKGKDGPGLPLVKRY